MLRALQQAIGGRFQGPSGNGCDRAGVAWLGAVAPSARYVHWTPCSEEQLIPLMFHSCVHFLKEIGAVVKAQVEAMLRFRCFLPLMAPVLAVIGWWWYASRKKKEMAAPVVEEEEEESTAIREVLNGMVEGRKAGLKVGEGNTAGRAEENHILAATAVMPVQSLAGETLGREDTPSRARHGGLTADPDADGSDSSGQGTPGGTRAAPRLPDAGDDEAGGAEAGSSTLQPVCDDQRVADASECGTGEELPAGRGAVAEEDGTLAPRPPPHSPGTAIGSVPAELPEAPGPDLDTAREVEVEAEGLAVPFPERLGVLPVPKDRTFRSATPDTLCPDDVVPSRHVPAALAPPSDVEAEGPPPQQGGHGTPSQTGLVLDPRQEESGGPAPGLNRELISVATREPAVSLCDVSEEGSARPPQPSDSSPPSGEPRRSVVDQGEQDGSQGSMEVLCHLDEERVDDVTEPRPLVPDGSLSTSPELARDEEVLNACVAPPAQEGAEEDSSSSGTEPGQDDVSPEDSPPSPGEPHADDVTGTEDSGCSTGQSEDPEVSPCESSGEAMDRKPSDRSGSCIPAAQTETPSPAPDQAEQGGDLTSDGMHLLLQEGPLSAGHEASQNGHPSTPVREEEAEVAVSDSRTTGPQKGLGPEATPPCQGKSPTDDVTGTEDSGSGTYQSGDGASSPDDVPFTVPEAEQNPAAILAVSQGSDGQGRGPERKSAPSLEEGHQEGAPCRGERVTDTDLQNGSHVVSEMEGDRSGEISSEALQEDPAARKCESVDDRKPSNQSSSCILSTQTTQTPCSAPDLQTQQEDALISGGILHPSQEGPFSVIPPEASGNGLSQISPVQEEPDDDAGSSTQSEQKSPSPETAPSRLDELQASEDVAGAEDSGCSTCQSEDGGSSQDHVPSSVPSRAEQEEEENLVPASATSRDLEEQSKGPERRSEPSSGEHQPAPLPRGERLSDPHLQNGSVQATETEADLSGGAGCAVIGRVSQGCAAGPREDQGRGGRPACPPTPDLTVWEVEVPKLLVGRLIGKRGRYVTFLKQRSGAKIHFSPRLYSQEFQICHIEGTKQQVHKALGLIGNKFEELDLTNIYTPPAPPKLPSLPITSWLLLPEEVPVEVAVVKIVSAGHMFVQQPKHPSYPALSALDQDMRLCYSQPAPGLPSPTEVGVVCAAPGPDGAWWRAQVISFHRESGEAEIRYVDYGGYHRAKMDTLHQIRSDFTKLPFQGAEVVLSNVKPLPGGDGFSAEASAALEEMTRGAPLLAQMTGHSRAGVPFVQMWRAVQEELVSVNRTLVDRGLAAWLESS
ncbi:A-kinase anchor protein 1, mitochondrial-like [Anguilla anguilla]|uniref:A-kinase anchor protein 1, mitochondrial-like n=1 Tax=Anguilla anguilla TaxID=7936 RepID=UPI0015AD8D48|nr:A-kinase anchor protein 1, mitochondrial-like [Anguilla anguilla]